MIESLLFYILALLAVVPGLAILVSTNIVRMAYWLTGMLLSVAGLYFLMGAYFLAVVQIIVYAGGVAVLVVFGVMLTARHLPGQFLPRRWEALWITVVSVILLASLVLTILNIRWPYTLNQASNMVADIGKSLLGKFLGPFELASILLLVVLLGAAYLARPKVPTPGIKDDKK